MSNGVSNRTWRPWLGPSAAHTQQTTYASVDLVPTGSIPSV